MKLCFLTAFIFFFFTSFQTFADNISSEQKKAGDVKTSNSGGEDSGGGIKEGETSKSFKNLHALIINKTRTVSVDINFLCVESVDGDLVKLKYLKPSCNSSTCKFMAEELKVYENEVMSLCSKKHGKQNRCKTTQSQIALIRDEESESLFSFLTLDKNIQEISLCSTFRL